MIELSSYVGLKRVINQNYLNELVLTNKAKNELRTYVSKQNEPPTPDEVMALCKVDKDVFYSLKISAVITILCFAAPRNSAVRTLKISSINLSEDIYEIIQSPKDGTETKFGKNIKSFITFPNNEIKDNFDKYINRLESYGLNGDYPLFPLITNFSKNTEDKPEFSREFPKSNKYINKLLKAACNLNGIKKRITVHSCRHYYAKYIKPYLHSAEEIEACAKSMGHNGVGLLFNTYGKLNDDEIRNIMIKIQKRILEKKYNSNVFELIKLLKIFANDKPDNSKKRILNDLENIQSEFES